ncbi:uncharacterized protein LOC121733673 [Aricia agestis]|uniref:uncharacterized protein LOC121733673 n=1 Tax=Aricia agestis TaxID=91739 RepID=UPI001C206F4A|nr:uncharacterized protein LOC121733673 [Aricia agestis]
MFSRLVLVLCLLKLVSGLTNLERACAAENAEVLDNDFMVGTWYEVYRFAMWLNLPPSISCVNIKITEAPSDEVERYRTAHGEDEALKFDTKPVLFDRHDGYYKGMLTGSSQAKFLAWDPSKIFFETEKYEGQVYKKVNDDYMLFHTCALPNFKTLLSRRRDQTEEELQQVIATIEEVQRMETQRFCAP